MQFKGETYEQTRLRWSKGIECFAYFPKQMICGTWVWWETYWAALPGNYSAQWTCALERQDAVCTGPKTPPPPKPMKVGAAKNWTLK